MLVQNILSDFAKHFCGRSYLIVQMDSDDELLETDESNNYKAEPIVVNCPQGIYTLKVI